MIAKLCAVCGADLAHRKRADHRYCGVRCRVRAHRLRVAVGIRDARRQRRADREARAKASRRQATEQTITELREQLHQEQEANKKLAERVERLKHRLDSAREDHDTAAGEYERRIAKLERQQSRPSNDDELRRVTNQLREANQQIARLKQQRAAAMAVRVTIGASPQREQPQPLVEANRRLRAYAEEREHEVKTLKRELSEAKGKLAKFEALPTREAELTAEIAHLKNALREAQAREHSLQRQNSALRQTADIALDRAAYEKELRERQGGWIRVAETIGMTILGATTIKKDGQTPAETKYKATPSPATAPSSPLPTAADAAHPDEPDWAEQVRHAKSMGWRPEIDLVVLRKREELEAEDALAQHHDPPGFGGHDVWTAQHQKRIGHPTTTRALPADAKIDEIAEREALRARWQYHAHPPSERQGCVSWLRPHHKLDMKSEQDLLRRIRQRRDELRRQAMT